MTLPEPSTPSSAGSALAAADLRRALALPSFDGRGAQGAMEPEWRGPPPPSARTEPPREAAALAFVFPGAAEGRLLFPLTLRPDHLREHRGQVSFPGGRPAVGEPLERTALREAREELGLEASERDLVGRLAPVYIPVTHTRLHVFVALGADPRPLRPCEREVARVAFPSLDDLLDARRRRRETRTIRGREVEVPWFDLAGLEVWGATAMALSDLAERLRLARARSGRDGSVAGPSPAVSEG